MEKIGLAQQAVKKVYVQRKQDDLRNGIVREGSSSSYSQLN